MGLELDVKDEIYNLERTAERCRVPKDTVLDWIDAGLRAFPLGSSKQYRARDYIILEEWLLDFFRAKGVVDRKAASIQKEKAASPPAARREKYNRDEPLGPRP